MKAVVVGATSAVGHHIVEALTKTNDWRQVVIIVRKKTQDFTAIDGAEKVQQRVLPSLDDLATLQEDLRGFDAMFCSLGAYMKLDGPEVARKVDLDYVVASADLAVSAGIASFALVSAPGADASLPEDAEGWQLYKKLKGLAEEAIKSKKIKYIYIFRPGILFGRQSSKSAASVRSKGNWDKFINCFSCCCRCLVTKAGVQCGHLGAVMVDTVKTKGRFLESSLDENGGNMVIGNSEIVNYNLAADGASTRWAVTVGGSYTGNVNDQKSRHRGV